MEISLDYSKAERQADTLEQCGNDMLQQSNDISNLITEIRRAWQGDTSEIYIKKLEALGNDLKQSSDKCKQDAKDFRARINSIRKADEEARAFIEKK
ncbi:MAG: hypothetical protein FWD38_05600 [Oscillospiraceae bacterium]|nr:hypothetical protein [Oscillospiraceae bacterium]